VRLRELHQKYRDDVEFIVGYVKEAHPTDKWWLGRSRTQRLLHEWSGNPARLDVVDPVTLEQRREVAASCQTNLFDGVVPLYVDAMDDAVSARYAGKPTRIYLIGKDGRVLYNPGIGPFGFSPDELEKTIAEYLAEAS
jgi:hypothetical protein